MAISLLGQALDKYKRKGEAAVSSGKDVAYRTWVGILGGTVMFWIAIFLYATFYYTYMPAVSHARPVYLQFQSCGKDVGVCSYPTANVTLTRRQQLLMFGQPYKVFLDLEMPESPKNRDLGMFMTCLQVMSADGEVTTETCRSAMLRYKSPMLRTMATLAFAPFLLAGSSEEKQTVAIELYASYEEDPIKPATDMRVELHTHFVEVYAAHLRIHAHFTGLRYLMFNWPILSVVVGVVTNLFFLTAVSMLSWYHFLPQHDDGDTTEKWTESTRESLNVPLESKIEEFEKIEDDEDYDA